MYCNHPTCRSTKHRVTESREDERVPMGLEGFNIKRRLRICEQGHKFWTIELPESEFERLRTVRGGGFDPPMGGIRGR